MSKTSSKAKKSASALAIADHAHASRVAAHLDASMYTAPAGPKAVEAVAVALPKAAALEVTRISAPVMDWFGNGFSAMSDAVETAQKLAQESVESFAARRADATSQAVALQQKLIAMAQSNVADGVQAMQKLLTARSFNDAVALHSEYARDIVRTLSEQARELQALSAKFAEDTHKPLAEHWSK